MKKEARLIIGFYLLMAVLNYVTVSIDKGIWLGVSWIILNFIIKALLTIPLLWLYFELLPKYSVWKRAFLHLLTMLIFTWANVEIYYILCDSLNIFRLQGVRIVWDIYLTVLFYGVQFGIFHLYVYAKQLKEQELLAAELSKISIQSELSALKAQLNPHFLHNVFNTINAAIPNTAKDARNMVNKLSDLFRYQLKASKQEYVPLGEEIAFVRKYLALEKERFANRLEFKIDIDEKITDEMVPPFILQPLVENTIKHGLSSLIKGGTVSINVQKKNDMLLFSICDTGIGIGSESKENLLKKGVGLFNTNERLIRMYNTSLEFRKNAPHGLCVNFAIPLQDSKLS